MICWSFDGKTRPFSRHAVKTDMGEIVHIDGREYIQIQKDTSSIWLKMGIAWSILLKNAQITKLNATCILQFQIYIFNSLQLSCCILFFIYIKKKV